MKHNSYYNYYLFNNYARGHRSRRNRKFILLRSAPRTQRPTTISIYFPHVSRTGKPKKDGRGGETVSESKEETALNKSSGTRYPAERGSRKTRLPIKRNAFVALKTTPPEIYSPYAHSSGLNLISPWSVASIAPIESAGASVFRA